MLIISKENYIIQILSSLWFILWFWNALYHIPILSTNPSIMSPPIYLQFLSFLWGSVQRPPGIPFQHWRFPRWSGQVPRPGCPLAPDPVRRRGHDLGWGAVWGEPRASAWPWGTVTGRSSWTARPPWDWWFPQA